MEDKQPHSDLQEYGSYEALEQDFVKDVLKLLDDTKSEIAERNDQIDKLDGLIFGDSLTKSIRVPIGHDKTQVNWLRRAVEIHTEQFMGDGFQLISTYNSTDITTAADEDEKVRLKTENKVAKEYAEQRRNLCDQIIEDNGGPSLFKDLAQNASAVGNAVVKMYYDEEAKTIRISPVESIENFYAIWGNNNFREADAYAYVYQISLQQAARQYGCGKDTPTSPLGQPLNFTYSTNTTTVSDQKMVTIIELTGSVPGWTGKNGRIKKTELGKETEINILIIGNKLKRIITDSKKLPRYYVLPNKRQRRRPWGVSDISDAAIDINLTYIETLSDWRTVASKVNFPKFKALGFGANVQMPKPKPRTVELIPLADGQDIQLIQQGDSNQFDFKAQLAELEKEFVRETGISRVLFSDPTITLNSNQALMTSMKPTTDIAQAKKTLWKPVLTQMFTDSLALLAQYDKDVKELVEADDSWTLKVVYPDYIAKYDPSAFSMLLNRFNAGTISVQSFMEQLGETKEEIDRISDEMGEPTTAAIIGKQLPMLAQNTVQKEIQKEQLQMQEEQQRTQANVANETGVAPNGRPLPGPSGATGAGSVGNSAQISTPANNTEGSGIMSQAGSGATTASPAGAVTQTAQTMGA